MADSLSWAALIVGPGFAGEGEKRFFNLRRNIGRAVTSDNWHSGQGLAPADLAGCGAIR